MPNMSPGNCTPVPMKEQALNHWGFSPASSHLIFWQRCSVDYLVPPWLKLESSEKRMPLSYWPVDKSVRAFYWWMIDVGGPSPLWMGLPLRCIKMQAEWATRRQHCSISSASSSCLDFLLWLPLMMECDCKPDKLFLLVLIWMRRPSSSQVFEWHCLNVFKKFGPAGRSMSLRVVFKISKAELRFQCGVSVSCLSFEMRTLSFQSPALVVTLSLALWTLTLSKNQVPHKPSFFKLPWSWCSIIAIEK